MHNGAAPYSMLNAFQGRGKRGVGIGMPLVWLNNWDFLGSDGKILALGIGYFAAEKANYPKDF